MNDVIGSVRQVVQDFLAPELRQHRAELVAIRTELTTKIEAAESHLDSKINVVDSKIDVLKSEMRSGFSALVQRSKMQYFVVSYRRPAKSQTYVSVLRDWKRNVVSCLNTQ